METFRESAHELRIIADVDILVAGAGPAGIGAAIRAASFGAKVMLIETQDCIGGTATAGMMSHWVGNSSSKIMSELFDRTYNSAQELGWDNDNTDWKASVYHEVEKIVLDEMMQEAGVKVLFYTTAVDAHVEDDRIKGVIVQNKSGRGYIKAKYVIDSTGDGDVAAFAGVPYTLGREKDERMQPCTLMFKVGGVDYSTAEFPGSFETKVQTAKGELQALAKELLPFPAGHVLLYKQPTPGTACCNMTNAIEIDATKAEDLTRALQTCRSQIIPIVKFLKEYVPGYENCWLMSSASLIGVRETRHFEGVESLSEHNILDAKIFDNWVVRRAFFNFDVHNLTGASLDKTGIQEKWSQPEPYSIPYGCLLPKNIEGLLLSGRNISGSHLAHSNFRVMPICIALGEAAGTAAALAVKNNISLKDVDVKEIQKVVGE